MNIYLIYQGVNNGYDTYDSAVVVAKNAEDARNVKVGHNYSYVTDWADPADVHVRLIGTAFEEDVEEGEIVCASFNAG